MTFRARWHARALRPGVRLVCLCLLCMCVCVCVCTCGTTDGTADRRVSACCLAFVVTMSTWRIGAPSTTSHHITSPETHTWLTRTHTHAQNHQCSITVCCVWTVTVVRRVLGRLESKPVENNSRQCQKVGISGFSYILLGHTRLYSRSLRPICQHYRDQL